MNKFGDKDSVSLSISVTCLDCYLTGLLLVETTGVKTDTSLLGGLALFFKDPTEIIVNALDLNLEFSFPDLSGHFEFDITFAASGTYTVTLYSSKTPVGAEACILPRFELIRPICGMAFSPYILHQQYGALIDKSLAE